MNKPQLNNEPAAKLPIGQLHRINSLFRRVAFVQTVQPDQGYREVVHANGVKDLKPLIVSEF